MYARVFGCARAFTLISMPMLCPHLRRLDRPHSHTPSLSTHNRRRKREDSEKEKERKKSKKRKRDRRDDSSDSSDGMPVNIWARGDCVHTVVWNVR